MKMMTRMGVSLVVGMVLSPLASAVELVHWNRVPIKTALAVGQERIVYVDRNVKLALPVALADTLRVQNAGGALYLKAAAPFPETRIPLQVVETGEIILLDVTAQDAATVTANSSAYEPMKVLYGEGDDLSSFGITAGLSPNYASDGMPGSAGAGAVSARASGSSANSAAAPAAPRPTADDAVAGRIGRTDATSRTPAPISLTRYAAQNMYAPLRTVEALPGVSAVPVRAKGPLGSLLPSLDVDARAVAAWKLADYTVTAVRLINRAPRAVLLDPRLLNGDLYSAAFQHPTLGPAGSAEDTTTAYLVTQGKGLESALLPLPYRPAKGAK
ncbi:TIGR03749 family integrating conjugative element protein [Pokkaliibacter sp. MBI-7]|uniref:TIGR03749 family integrating conjugative element protein n=1 Tax=Pokkaliibacter sp. MBI-7 TaxID=3040600 RepID=UPI0024479361|nr:TIGR03749 family integrating conjugative element protein [Pokkaliibacter sp. MBI-7]MDH2431024.1 TIGR03749 family integrating conjugative element protein [Pokkaliibacter sp. MBI-7]MDH2434743.1 TIGR03749 family integrating conjugative element protein [Pokkaliibacter sp. MBI-7]MDH2434780.1 TIGR03749 family integrating conjugative element protein [Pokkaliibacter sp. MBI-7]MDH2436719.1 TIGR03749 family integrating conjugative element protein [Pokkaliibacter sp. MBI-7]MDH2436819.1 TIGR03749 famil